MAAMCAAPRREPNLRILTSSRPLRSRNATRQHIKKKQQQKKREGDAASAGSGRNYILQRDPACLVKTQTERYKLGFTAGLADQPAVTAVWSQDGSNWFGVKANTTACEIHQQLPELGKKKPATWTEAFVSLYFL